MESWKNIRENKFNELLIYSKKIYKEKFKTINFIEFAENIEKRFGIEISYTLLELLWNRLHEDIKINQLFGFDFEEIEKIIDTSEILATKIEIIKNEINRIDNVLNRLDLFRQQFKRIINDQIIPEDMPDDIDYDEYILKKIDDKLLNEIYDFIKKRMLNDLIGEMEAIDIVKEHFIIYKENLQQLNKAN